MLHSWFHWLRGPSARQGTVKTRGECSIWTWRDW
jgi:hypothetical protein